jgi:hypothetical protein
VQNAFDIAKEAVHADPHVSRSDEPKKFMLLPEGASTLAPERPASSSLIQPFVQAATTMWPFSAIFPTANGRISARPRSPPTCLRCQVCDPIGQLATH